jgi:hypothetical protein
MNGERMNVECVAFTWIQPQTIETKRYSPGIEWYINHFLRTYRVAQKSVNLKHSFVLTGMFRFKPASRFVERYQSVVSCALNTKDLISKNFYKISK